MPDPTITTDACYLIERSQPEGQDPPYYWRGPNMHGWTPILTKAKRFLTKEEAEKALDSISGFKNIHRDMGHVVEHVFIDCNAPTITDADRAAASEIRRAIFTHLPPAPYATEELAAIIAKHAATERGELERLKKIIEATVDWGVIMPGELIEVRSANDSTGAHIGYEIGEVGGDEPIMKAQPSLWSAIAAAQQLAKGEQG